VTLALAWISVAPVKGLALRSLHEAELTPVGVKGDRLFHLVGDDGRLANRKQVAALAGIVAEAGDEGRVLRLRFPDGTEVAGEPVDGPPVTTAFYGRPVEGRVVEGPWGDALSAYTGRSLRLVRVTPGEAHDRGPGAAVSIVSTASLERLRGAAGIDEPVDQRRFRMLLGVSGAEPHEEDGWLGREVAIGSAVVRPLSHVGRCAVTTQDPDTGEVTLDTLHVLRAYRGDVETEEPLPFGVWGEVVVPGRIAVGDPVEPR
jgi:uncharacterized protein YcbX